MMTGPRPSGTSATMVIIRQPGDHAVKGRQAFEERIVRPQHRPATEFLHALRLRRRLARREHELQPRSKGQAATAINVMARQRGRQDIPAVAAPASPRRTGHPSKPPAVKSPQLERIERERPPTNMTGRIRPVLRSELAKLAH